MRTRWYVPMYDITLKLTLRDAESCSQSGDNSEAVMAVMKKPYVKIQLEKLDVSELAKELKEYGAWDSEELDKHQENLVKIVWLAAGQISEDAR